MNLSSLFYVELRIELNDHRLKAVDSICRLKVERSAIRRTKVKPYSDALRAFYFLINAKAVPPEGEGFKPVEWKIKEAELSCFDFSH